jgi:hypothetical protein
VGRACGTNGEKKNAYRILWESQKERDHYEDRHRWVDNIKMDIRELGWGAMDWIDLAQDRDPWRALVNIVLNPLVP